MTAAHDDYFATPTPGDLSARHVEVLREFVGRYAGQIDNRGEYNSGLFTRVLEAIAALSALPAAGGEVTEWRWVDERGRAMTNWKQGDPPPMTAVSDTKGTMRVEVRPTPQPSAADDYESWAKQERQREDTATRLGSAAVGAQGDGLAAAAWRAMGDENYLFGGGPFEDAHPEDQDAARRIAAAVLLAARAEPSRLRDALRCVLDIGSRRLLLPSEVVHWEALLAEASTAPAAGKGVDERTRFIAWANQRGMVAFDCEAAFGMEADDRFISPETSLAWAAWKAALTRQPVAGDGDADFELWQDGEFVAGSSGPRAEAWREILHYAAQYEQDGAVTIMEVIRRPLAAPAATPTDGGEG